MTSSARPRRARVHFDELTFAEDLNHASLAGRIVARDARAELERDGADTDKLLACQAEGRDGTRLERSVKLYLPDRTGAWRMVFEITRDATDRQLTLSYLAFGVGHPTHAWQLSAYQVADRRLHPPE